MQIHHGEVLKTYLRENRIKQGDFAENLGISRNYFLTKLKEYRFKDDFKQNVITLLQLPPDFFESNDNVINSPNSRDITQPAANSIENQPYGENTGQNTVKTPENRFSDSSTNDRGYDRNIQMTGRRTNPRLEATPLYNVSESQDRLPGQRFVDVGEGKYLMYVSIVPQYAWAGGYTRGYQDPEFYEGLKEVSIEVTKEHSGHYLAFEIKGDSMIPADIAEIKKAVLPGWIAIARELPRQQWQYKLHTHYVDNWIINHKTEGILIKNIVNHDIEKGQITIHSLNPDYDDEVFDLDECLQIFNVVKFVIE